MNTDESAPLKAHKEIVINNWPQWQPGVTEAKLEGTLQPGTIFRWKASGITIVSTGPAAATWFIPQISRTLKVRNKCVIK